MKTPKGRWLSKRRNSIPAETPRQPARGAPALGPSPLPAESSAPQVRFLQRSPWRCAGRLGLAATRSAQIPFPSPGPQAWTPPSLPPSQPAGPFPRSGTAARPRRQEAEPLLMLFQGAPPRPPGAPRLFPALKRPPLKRLRSVLGGRGSYSCQRRRRWLRSSVFAEEKHETDPPALPLPFPRPEPPSWVAGNSPRGVSPPPRSRFLGPPPGGSHCPRGGGSGNRPRLAAPGSVPAVPERRCRRHRRSPPPAAHGPGWVELRCPRTSSHCSARI